MIIRQKSGLTLIELLVVIGIVSVIIVLSTFAVQTARVQSRLATCKNRLHQHCLAMLSYESSQMHLPFARWQYDLLPYLELTNTRAAMDSGNTPEGLEVFVCPSDQLTTRIDFLYGNYLACSGVWLTLDGHDGVVSSRSSEFPGGTPATKMSEITGGTSSTAFISEGVMAKPETDASPLGVIWQLPGHSYELDELDEFANACMSMPSDPESQGFQGSRTSKGNIFQFIRPTNYAAVVGLGHNLYNHAIPPQFLSCKNGKKLYQAIVPPSSMHLSTVNVGFCDGHVQTFAREVDIVAWRKLGSKE